MHPWKNFGFLALGSEIRMLLQMMPPSWKAILRLRGKDGNFMAISQPKPMGIIFYHKDILISTWKGHKGYMRYSSRCFLLEMRYSGSSWCYTRLFWCGAAAGRRAVSEEEEDWSGAWVRYGAATDDGCRERGSVFLFRGSSIIHQALFLAEHQIPSTPTLHSTPWCAKELFTRPPYRQKCLAWETAECNGQAHDEQVACCREEV